MKNRIIPNADPQGVLWLNNFAATLGGYAAKYNILKGEVAAIVNRATFLAYWINALSQIRDYTSKVTNFKNEMSNGVEEQTENPTEPVFPSVDPPPPIVLAGIFPFVMTIVKRIKARKDYAVSDGDDLGIEGEEIELEKINLLLIGLPE